MQNRTIMTLMVLSLVLSTRAFALDLTCRGDGETVHVAVTEDQFAMENEEEGAARETQDPDCVYRASRYACYEDGQYMFNVPLALLEGKVKRGVIYFQSDTGDNADSHNHALLGAPYRCVVE